MFQFENNLNHSIPLNLSPPKLSVNFQPIFSARSGRIFGYEAFIKDIDIENLFLNTNSLRLILEMIFRRNAIKTASEFNIEGYLFINILPENFSYSEHMIDITSRFAEEFNFPKDKIILKVNEELTLENYELFINSVSNYKKRGYKIAIDNFGNRIGEFKLLGILKPDIVKLDRYFIDTIVENYFSKSFIEFTISVCHNMNIMVMADEIETVSQLRELVNLGVDLLQGFYLGKPEQIQFDNVAK